MKVKIIKVPQNAAKWNHKHADGGPLEYDFSHGFLYPAPDSLATNIRAVSVPVQETVQAPVPIDYDELKRRQYYLESKFNDRAVNRHSGAMGAYQIMPITLKDYTQRTGEAGDLNDYSFNEKVRDYYMNRHLNSSWATKNNQSEYNRVAKALAAYNWGPGNLLNYLNGQKASGVDIYQGTDWIKGLPGETRNYIKWILDGEDIGNRTTNAGYEKAKKRRFDFGGYVGEFVKAHGGTENILKVIQKLKTRNSFAAGGDVDPKDAEAPSNMQDVDDAVGFVRDYFRSDGYLRRLRDAGLPAEQLNIRPRIYPEPVNVDESFAVGDDVHIGVKPAQIAYPVTNQPITGKPIIDLGQVRDNENALGFFPATAAAHEAAHLNPLYNTRYKDWYREDRPYKDLSPYYGNDYSKVPGYYMYVLSPNKGVNPHDVEASENYSDLMALRYFLQKNGIFDSFSKTARFTSDDYNKIFDAKGGEHLRFIKNHSKDAVIKAINDVAQLSVSPELLPGNRRA